MEIATFSKRDFRKSLIGAETYKFRIVETFIEKLKDKFRAVYRNFKDLEGIQLLKVY